MTRLDGEERSSLYAEAEKSALNTYGSLSPAEIQPALKEANKKLMRMQKNSKMAERAIEAEAYRDTLASLLVEKSSSDRPALTQSGGFVESLKFIAKLVRKN